MNPAIAITRVVLIKKKQPAAKPKTTNAKETPVDEDGDAKPDNSVSTKTPQRKDDRSLPQ